MVIVLSYTLCVISIFFFFGSVNIVYATYEIPGYPRVVTNGHRLDESIQFNDKRVFPTNKLHHSIFAEFIQTKTLDIEVIVDCYQFN